MADAALFRGHVGRALVCRAALRQWLSRAVRSHGGAVSGFGQAGSRGMTVWALRWLRWLRLAGQLRPPRGTTG